MLQNAILLLANALFIWGVHGLIRTNKELDDWLTRIAVKYDIPEWVPKPIIDCPPCMSSVYGTGFYVVANGGIDWGLPVYLLCLVGLNFLISQAISKE